MRALLKRLKLLQRKNPDALSLSSLCTIVFIESKYILPSRNSGPLFSGLAKSLPLLTAQATMGEMLYSQPEEEMLSTAVVPAESFNNQFTRSLHLLCCWDPVPLER